MENQALSSILAEIEMHAKNAAELARSTAAADELRLRSALAQINVLLARANRIVARADQSND